MGGLLEGLRVAKGGAEVRPQGGVLELDQGPFAWGQLGEVVGLLHNRRGRFRRLGAAGASSENESGEGNSHEAAG